MKHCTLLSAKGALSDAAGYRRRVRGRNCILTTTGAFGSTGQPQNTNGTFADAVRHSVRTGWMAARGNLKAIIALQVFMLLLLLCYYFVPFSRPFFSGIERLREVMGISFGFVAFGLGAGVLGEVLRVWQEDWNWTARNSENLAFNTLVYGTFGVISAVKFDAYALLVGTGTGLSVILGKLVLDQCIYGPMFFNPVSAVIWYWKGSGYSGGKTRDVLRRPLRFYVGRVLPVQLTNWVMWIPTTVIVVSLPTALQLPTVVLGMVAWQILMSAIAVGGKAPARGTARVLSSLRVNWDEYRVPYA